MKVRNPLVQRITVDELMSEEYARLLVAPLARGVKTFKDEPDDWGAEKEHYVDRSGWPKDARKIGVPARSLTWDKLQEGRVFLAGQFKETTSNKKITGFRVKRGKRRVLRIDDQRIVKDKIKRLYSDLLQRG